MKVKKYFSKPICKECIKVMEDVLFYTNTKWLKCPKCKKEVVLVLD